MKTHYKYLLHYLLRSGKKQRLPSKFYSMIREDLKFPNRFRSTFVLLNKDPLADKYISRCVYNPEGINGWLPKIDETTPLRMELFYSIGKCVVYKTEHFYYLKDTYTFYEPCYNHLNSHFPWNCNCTAEEKEKQSDWLNTGTIPYPNWCGYHIQRKLTFLSSKFIKNDSLPHFSSCGLEIPDKLFYKKGKPFRITAIIPIQE